MAADFAADVWSVMMLMLAGVVALLMVGVAVDFSTGGDAADDEAAPDVNDLPPDGNAERPAAIDGGPGNDMLGGGDGDDMLHGHDGDDDMRGGRGNDTLIGGLGDDWLEGDGTYDAAGDDLLIGGRGNDWLAGQGGKDTLRGGPGKDTLFGGEGDDLLEAGPGDDWLSGGEGNDTLIAGPGNDDLDGGPGDDLLIGNDRGQAWLNGGAGADTLMPGPGDHAEGGEGADTFSLRPATERIPTIGDFDGREDRIEVHLPADAPDDIHVDFLEHGNGNMILFVDGNPVGEFHQPRALDQAQIVVVRA